MPFNRFPGDRVVQAEPTDVYLASALRGLADAVFLVDGKGRLRWANSAAERLFGATLEDWVGISGLELIHPDDLELALLSLATVQEKEAGTLLELRLRTVDGWRLVELVGAPIGPAAEGMLILSARDLTQRRRWEVAGNEVAQFRSLMQNAATVTMLVSADGQIEAVSGALTRLLGQDPEAVQGGTLADLVHPLDRPALASALARATTRPSRADIGPVTVEVRLRRRGDDRTVPFELVIVNLLDDPTVGGFVISGHDITRLRAAQDQLEAQANRDGLTGLPNRAALDRYLAAAIGRVHIDGDTLQVAFVDLDRFKPINDLLGHAAGDELLGHLAARLQGAVRAEDFVARFGGDEFVVVINAPTATNADLVERLEQLIAQPFQLSTGSAQIFASVGVVNSHPGQSSEMLLGDADAEMYRIKRTRPTTASAKPRRPLRPRTLPRQRPGSANRSRLRQPHATTVGSQARYRL